MPRLSLSWLLLALLVTGPAFAQTESPVPLAQPGQPGWQKSEPDGCFLWNNEPHPGETVVWYGACENQRATGPGAVVWKRGTREYKYEGTLRDNQLNGQGVYLSPDGDLYQGEFRNWKYHGQGLLTSASGARYKGDFRDGKFHGVGIYIYGNGDRYDGEFRDGKMSGRGQLNFASGKRYYGDFENNKPHGNGRLDSAGAVFTGRWVEGCFFNMTGRASIDSKPGLCW